MNLAYKHLDAKLRIAELSVGQWIGVLLGLAVGIAWGAYLSPLPPTPTLISAIYAGSLPVGAVFVGNVTEVSPSLLLRSALDWRRREGRFMPGAGASAHGYVVRDEAVAGPQRRRPQTPDLADLWSDR